MFRPNNIAFAWDSKRSIRTENYPQYKRTRKDKSQTLTPQEKLNRRIARVQFEEIKTHTLFELGFVNVFCVDGYEADDVMASLAESDKEKNFTLITTDKDLFQCLSSNCVIYDPRSDSIIDEEVLMERYDCTPEEWGEAKTIAGCRTDNVEGVQGVAEKTAIKYIHKKMKTSSKKYERIEASKDIIERNRDLVILPMSTMRKLTISDKNDISLEKFIALCDRLKFISLLNSNTFSKWESLLSGV